MLPREGVCAAPKPLLLSIVRDHDSKFIWGQWASPVIAGLARFTS